MVSAHLEYSFEFVHLERWRWIDLQTSDFTRGNVRCTISSIALFWTVTTAGGRRAWNDVVRAVPLYGRSVLRDFIRR